MIRQITYDPEAEMGYIHLLDPSVPHRIVKTEELFENDDFILDFGEKVPIVGIELEGKTAEKIKPFDGESKIFKKDLNGNGDLYYSFRLNEKEIEMSVCHPEAKTIIFHFSDKKCENFVGLDIIDVHSYSEEFLTLNE